MLIDDDEDDNFFHQRILRKSDVAEHIQVAQNGLDALDYLTKENQIPELIFLDVNMPKMNGWEFLEEYSKVDAKQNTQPIIIMLTTSLNPADKERAGKIYKIDGFETKPLTGEMLNRILDRFFAGGL